MNRENRCGMTALMLACLTDKLESLNALVAKGVHLDYENKFGQTALIVCCSVSKSPRLEKRSSPW